MSKKINNNLHFSSEYFRINVKTTNTFVKVINEETGNCININKNTLKKLTLEKGNITYKETIRQTLLCGAYTKDDLGDHVKADKERVNAYVKIRKSSDDLHREFFPNYSYRVLFDEVLGI